MEPIKLTKTAALASIVNRNFDTAKTHRTDQENVWISAMRNFNGEYSPDIEFREGGSSVFINITQMKTMAAFSRIMAIMMGPSGYPWNIKPTPHPILVKMGLSEPAAEVTSELSPEFKQELSEARSAADGMRNRIKDNLIESFWEEKFSRGALDLVSIGTMVCKGPVALPQKPKKWVKVESQTSILDRIKGALGMAKVQAETYQLMSDPMDEYRAVMEWVSPFEFYPDPSAYAIEDAMYAIHRHVMNMAQLVELISAPGFDPEEIKTVLENNPTGNWTQESWESSVDSINNRSQVGEKDNRFVVLEYWGYFSGADLREAGASIKDSELHVHHMANVWVCGGQAIKVALSGNQAKRIPFFVVPYEKVPYKIWGRGVPEKMEDPQSIINGSARAMVENMAMCAGPQLIYDPSRIAPGTDIKQIIPWGITAIKTVEGVSTPPVQFVKIDPVINELKLIMDIFRSFVQEVTSMPDLASGFTGQGEHNRTMGGMSMLYGAADSYTRSVIFNIDNHLTKPMIRAMYDWEMQYCPDPTIKGDMTIEASGVQGLMAKELTSQRLAELLQAVGQIPGGADYINMPELMKEVFRSLEVINDCVVLSEPEVQAKRAQAQEASIQQAAAQAQATNLPKPKAETTRNDAMLTMLQDSEPGETIRPLLFEKTLAGYDELDPQSQAALNMMKDQAVSANRAFASEKEIEILSRDLELAQKLAPPEVAPAPQAPQMPEVPVE